MHQQSNWTAQVGLITNTGARGQKSGPSDVSKGDQRVDLA